MNRLVVYPPFWPGAFRMHDAAARGHPIHLARPDRNGCAQAVAMHDFAVKQIGNGGKPDVRVGTNVEAIAGAEFGRAEMIEENERADHARSRGGQCATDGKVAEIDSAGHDDLAYRIALVVVSGLRVLAGKETHGATPLQSVIAVRVGRTDAAHYRLRCGGPAQAKAAQASYDIP